MTLLEQLKSKAETARYNMNTSEMELYNKHTYYMDILFQIMGIDMDTGVDMWKDIIKNYRFERRSQDFTYIAVDNFVSKFGLEKMLDLLKNDSQLEVLLFCESREVSIHFFKLLIENSTVDILKYYLGLLEKNTTDKMLRTSRKRKQFLGNEYSRFTASNKGFDLKKFIIDLSYTIKYAKNIEDKRIVACQEWSLTAYENWKEYNNSFNVDYYTPNTYMPEYVDIGIDWRELRPVDQNDFSDFPQIQKLLKSIRSPVKKVSDSVHNIKIAKDIIDFAVKRYKIVSISPNLGGKKSALMQFIAQNSSACFHFDSFFPSDDTSFTISCFDGTERENVLFDIQQRCIDIFSNLTVANEIVLGGIGLSRYIKYLQRGLPENYYEIGGVPIASPWCNTCYNAKDYLELDDRIKAQIEFLGETTFRKIMSAIIDILLPSLDKVYYSQKGHISKYSDDQLRNSQEALTNVMMDSGFFKTRWINEQKLYNLIHASYPDTIYQYHPLWLGKQSLDIYIPSLDTAIEYQGRQHYEAIDFLGGVDGLNSARERDARKRKLCNENYVNLLEWPYTTPVDKLHVMKFIKENLMDK